MRRSGPQLESSLLAAVVAAFLVLTSAACQPRRPALRHVILISIDTLRQDALGCYGNAKVRTPHIDALAKDGVLFRQAFTHAPSTLPSHSSMFFSEYPWNLDVFHNGDKLAVREASLQQLLKGKGCTTAAFTSLAVLKASYGLAQGFDEYSDDVSRNSGRPYLFADEVNDKVLPWLSAHYQQPFFLFIHYSDPHEPYVAKNAPADAELLLNDQPAGSFCFLKREAHRVELELKPGRNTIVFRKLPRLEARDARGYEIQRLRLSDPRVRVTPVAGRLDADDVMRFSDAASYTLENKTQRSIGVKLDFRGKASVGRRRMREQYFREVEWVDGAIGKLVAWLKAHDSYENCLLLLVADHGEGLGERGSFGHETQLYLSQLRIPFILVDHRRAGLEVTAPVTLLDLAPTALARLGIPRPGAWKGRDLSELIDRPDSGNRQQADVFSATFFSGRNRSTLAHWKLSVLRPPRHLIISLPSGRHEFYDIGADPGERTNLLRDAKRPDGYDALVASAGALARETEFRLRSRKASDIPEEQMEQLKALGYLGGSRGPMKE